MTSDLAAAHLLIKGRVQGVGYRFFAQDTAVNRHLTGWVRNLSGGNVECEVEGARLAIEGWLEELRQGPPLARVTEIQISWKPPQRQFNEFSIQG